MTTLLLILLTVLNHQAVLCWSSKILPPSSILLSDNNTSPYDLILVSSQSPALTWRLGHDLTTLMLSWVKWPTLVSTLPLLRIPEVIEIWPRNTSEFVHILKEVNEIFRNTVHACRIWRPLVFIQRPLDDHSDLTKEVDIGYPTNSDVYVFGTDGQQGPEIQEVYTIGKNRYVKKVDVEEKGPFSNFLNKVVRRGNFNGSIIRPMAREDPDTARQVTFNRLADGKIQLGRGVCVILLKTMQFALNFSIEPVIGRGIIYQDPNGTWTGMAKQMRNNEADITINLSPYLAYRLEALDPLHPVVKIGVKGFFKVPQASSIRNILISPLSWDTWLSLVGMWTLLVVSMVTIQVLRVRSFCVAASSDREMVEGSVLWVMGTFCQQGWYTTPTSRSLKVIFITTALLGYVTYVAFAAALVPILSLDTMPLDTKYELGRSGFRILGDVNLPHVEKTVEDLESLGGKHISHRQEDHLVGIESAIQQVVDGNAAFVGAMDGFLSVFQRLGYSSREFCDSYDSIPLSDFMAGFYVRKGSEFREIFNHKILMMNEHGLTNRHMRRYETQTSPHCLKASNKRRRGESIDMPDVATAFVIVVIGIILSLFQLALELVFAHKMKVNEDKPITEPYLN